MTERATRDQPQQPGEHTTVDAHVHLWRLARGDNISINPGMPAIFRDLEPPDLRPRLDAAGVGRVVAVQAAETLAEALYLIGLARRFDWIAGVVAWAEPASPAIEEELAALSWHPVLKGIRPIRDDNRSIAYLLDARLARGWAALEAHGLSLDILVQNWREIPLATTLARQLPNVSIILDHCGKPDIRSDVLEPWSEMLRAFAALPNVSCKLSGLMNCAAPGAHLDTVAPYAEEVIAAFGPDRVMWASDWPPLDLASDYATWHRHSIAVIGRLAPSEQSDVLQATASRIYRL